MQEYNEFLDEYGPAIAVASYIPQGGGATIFRHSVQEEIGSGAFSRVYRALSPSGLQERAIKLVRSEVKNDPIMLKSFRRGVASMRIVSMHGTPGMVAYDEAYEIPPCVIMPFVPGLNLEQAGVRPDFSFLRDGISIIRRVGEVVSYTHHLPERVLHRDIRPANIIVKPNDGLLSSDDRVVVLDFDLSWHEGADSDNPISPNMTTVLSYLAPEQIEQSLVSTARNVKVDTYGLCMTTLFLATKSHPDYQLRRSEAWPAMLQRLSLPPGSRPNWTSWMPRLRRLIDNGTSPDQAARMDFDTAVKELKLLESLRDRALETVCIEDTGWLTLDALAEEIFSRMLLNDRYKWSSADGLGNYIAARGVKASVIVTQHQKSRAIIVSFERDFDALSSYKTVRKYWENRGSQILAAMQTSGWTSLDSQQSRGQSLSLKFLVTEDGVYRNSTQLATGVRRAYEVITLE